MAEAPDPFIGAAVDGWTVVAPLGQGAMGSVYEARKGDQRAAIKVIRPDATDQENLARFRREAKLLQRIEHRSLVRCLGAGDIQRSVYLVLELLEGGSLQDVLDARGRLSPPEAVGVVRTLLEGISALHQAGVIHRDVKPSNVLLDREGRAKLADLGLARPTEGSSALTATGTILGTPYYMAPELIRGADPAPSNDVYACGALLYCALVGEPPYPGKNPLHVLQAHIKEPVPDLRAKAPHVPEKLAAAVDALLQKDPADRPATAAAALALLAPFKAAPLKPAKLLGAPAASGGGTTRAQPAPAPSAAARAALSTATAQAAAAASAPVRGPARPLAPVARRRGYGWLVAAVVLVVGLLGLERLARARPGQDGLRDLTRAADQAGAGTAGRTVFRVVDGARPMLDEALPWLALVAGLLLAERLLATRLRVGLVERLLLSWRARRLLLAGEAHQAALVWEQLGRRRAAGALLLARGMPALAADMFEAAGLLSEAQDARSKGEAASALGGSGSARSGSGRPLAGRTPLERSGLERSGEGTSAARALLEAGRVDEAIEAFRSAGRRYDAADLLEAKGRFTEALTELEAAWRAGGDGRDYWHHTGKKTLLEEARPRLATRIARLHERKDPLQAASWYERAGRAEEALAIYERLGDHRAAARCLLVGVPAEGALTDAQAERAAAAAEALRKVGDQGAVSLFVRVERLADAAKTCRELGDLASASTLFEQAGLLKEAGAAAEAAGDKGRAAALFDEGEEYVKAVELYEAAGQWSDAAEAASRAGQSEREAALRVKAGDRIGAAEVWLRLGRHEEALKAVQGVEKESGLWTQARTLAGEAHHRAGRHREAAAAFADGLPTVVNFREEVPSQLHYAESLEALGETERALQVLTRLEGKEIAPMDLNQRKGRLEPGRKGPPKGQPAAPPGESATRAAASGGAPTPGGSPRPSAASRIVTPNELIGTALERYELLRYIGEGSFAWVFEARHTTLGREAAVKVLKPGLAMGEAPRRFLREGRAVAGLKHPHLIEIYDGGDVDGLYYLALEFVKGPTLRKLIADEAPFPVARAARIGAGILSGLGAAHKKGIIHRDLKPANVLVGAGMQAKVLDFGLARVFDDAGQSATAGYLGTPRYASPEQARGQEVGEGADQYAAALVLFEMLTGKMPFESKTSLGYLSLHAHEPPKSIQELRADMPPGLADAVMRALEKDPKDRHENVGAFERAVAAFIGPPKRGPASGGGSPGSGTGRRPRSP